MPSAERSVTINRPAADVFAYIADGTTGPEWRSSVVDVKHESGDGVGAVYRQRVRGPLRRKITADYEITAFEPGKRLEFRAIAGPVRPKGSYRLSESNGKTKLTFKLDAELGRLRRLLMGRSVQKSMDAEANALDQLKEILESGRQAKTAAGANSAGSKGSGSAAGTSKTAGPAAGTSKTAASAGATSKAGDSETAGSTGAGQKSTSPARPPASRSGAVKPAAASKSTGAKPSAAKAPATPRTARRRTKAR